MLNFSNPVINCFQNPDAAQFSTAKLAPKAVCGSALPYNRCNSLQKKDVEGNAN